MSDTTAGPPLYFPGLSQVYSGLAPYGYPVMRFSAGAIIVYHGWAKLFGGFAPFVAEKVLAPMGFPAPYAWTYFLGILECVGAAMVAVGLFTRPLAAMLTIEMAVIVYKLFPNGYFFTMPNGGGWEYPAVLFGLFLGIAMRGSDRCSIDRMIGREF
jgi:putative oxidoreductase